MTEAPIGNGITGSTTVLPQTPHEEDTIITLIVVIIGILVAIVLLFSMGIFIDCRTQKKDSLIRKRSRLKVLNTTSRRATKNWREDTKSFATDMCPNGTSSVPGDEIV